VFYNPGKQQPFYRSTINLIHRMFYRPNFCCNCGEKIERIEWTMFSSRKFCDLCQTEFRAKDVGTKLLAVLGIVISTAVISSIFRPAQPPSRPVPTQFVTTALPGNQGSAANLNTTSTPPLQSQAGTNASTSTVSSQPAEEPKQRAEIKAAEPVYYCGAATKKGTPCSRRVKKPGERCWQHQGMPSIVAESGTVRK
jgi:hypothetical protein